MRKLVDKMVLCGRLERIIHEELDPKVTYVKPGNMVPLELELQAMAYSFNRGRLTEQDVEAVKDILAKAEIVAEKRIKRKFCA
jgi:hypothetical protein